MQNTNIFFDIWSIVTISKQNLLVMYFTDFLSRIFKIMFFFEHFVSFASFAYWIFFTKIKPQFLTLTYVILSYNWLIRFKFFVVACLFHYIWFFSLSINLDKFSNVFKRLCFSYFKLFLDWQDNKQFWTLKFNTVRFLYSIPNFVNL